MKTLYSVLEQHLDGTWWYHPRYTFSTREEAEKEAQEFSERMDNRPTMIFEHTEPMFQEYSTALYGDVFHFGGMIEWPKCHRGKSIDEI